MACDEKRSGYTAKRLTDEDAYDIAELLRVSLDDAHWLAQHPRLREIRDKMIVRLGDVYAHTEGPTVMGTVGDDLPMIGPTGIANEEARRDFDGFNVDERLRVIRWSLRSGDVLQAALETAALDEYLSRGGSLPVAWLGPDCIQEGEDFGARLRATAEVASRMSPDQRQMEVNGYGSLPALDSVWFPCKLRESGCSSVLLLTRAAVDATPDAPRLSSWIEAVAARLGWRHYRSAWWCPAHVVSMKLVCGECRSVCPACTCDHAPGWFAVDAEEPVRLRHQEARSTTGQDR